MVCYNPTICVHMHMTLHQFSMNKFLLLHLCTGHSESEKQCVLPRKLRLNELRKLHLMLKDLEPKLIALWTIDEKNKEKEMNVVSQLVLVITAPLLSEPVDRHIFGSNK